MDKLDEFVVDEEEEEAVESVRDRLICEEVEPCVEVDFCGSFIFFSGSFDTVSLTD